MPDFDRLVGQVEEQGRFTRDVRLILDPAAFTQAQELTWQLDRHIHSGHVGDGEDVTGEGSPVGLARRLQELHEVHPERLFRFEARTAAEWTDLAASGPDGPKFWSQVMADSCVIFMDEPCADERPDVEVFERLRATLTPAQWAALSTEVRMLNEQLFDLRPTRAATALLRGTRPNSTSATDS